jgi:hypothetical protein
MEGRCHADVSFFYRCVYGRWGLEHSRYQMRGRGSVNQVPSQSNEGTSASSFTRLTGDGEDPQESQVEDGHVNGKTMSTEVKSPELGQDHVRPAGGRLLCLTDGVWSISVLQPQRSTIKHCVSDLENEFDWRAV